MKNGILSLVLFAVIAGVIITSCQTSSQKGNTTDVIAQDSIKTTTPKIDPAYPAFKTDALEKIADNDLRIADIRSQLDKSGAGMLKGVRGQRVDDLQKQNASLKYQISNYDAKPSEWEAFKLRFNHDSDKLHEALLHFGK
jgi:hypothetical protein